MKNVYICGKAGSGKTVTAQFLRDQYKYRTAKFAFPVYQIGYNYFDMKEKDRALLQLVGTEAGRYGVNNDLWVNRLLEDIQIVNLVCDMKKIERPQFVLDDCRFPNEHRALQAAGWVGINLSVTEENRILRLKGRDGTAQIETLNHYSETACDEFSQELVQLDCNGTVAESMIDLDKLVKGNLFDVC
jgi:Cdc6-like AAA superfamily ATPase